MGKIHLEQRLLKKWELTVGLYWLRQFQVLRKSSALFHVALRNNIVTVRAMIYESRRVDQQLHPPQRGCKN